jgi:hypothetical protein
MHILHVYFGRFSCINAYIFKGLLGHKNPTPNDKRGRHTPLFLSAVLGASSVATSSSFLRWDIQTSQHLDFVIEICTHGGLFHWHCEFPCQFHERKQQAALCGSRCYFGAVVQQTIENKLFKLYLLLCESYLVFLPSINLYKPILETAYNQGMQHLLLPLNFRHRKV